MMSKKRVFRFITVVALISLSTITLAVRYAQLAFQGPEPAAASRIAIDRGAIYDRNGVILAMNIEKYNLACWKPELPRDRFEAEVPALALALGCAPEELLERYDEAATDFFYLRKRIPSETGIVVRDYLEQSGVRGIVLETLAGRMYPERRLASHALGFVGADNHGLAGLERTWDSSLLPSAAKDAAPDRASGDYVGASMYLSIDANVQYEFERIARETLAATEAEAVMLFAVDVRSGELYAYVSMPDFDPNDITLEGSSLYNRPAVYAYEPGSVFKVFTMATLYESRAVDLASTFVCNGAYERTAGTTEKITIKCMGVHGNVDLLEILEYSCNSGAAYASDRIASLDFYNGLRAFGFGAPTGIGFFDETSGLLRTPEKWSLRSKPTIAMGQEVLVSAMQVLQAACTVANGGVLVKPTLVRKVALVDGRVEKDEGPVELRRVMSSASARTIVDAMEGASRHEGTGGQAGLGDVRIAVKTGTAQMIDETTKMYSDTDYIASCLSIFPVEAPRYAVYAVVVKPRGDSVGGGRVAAPAVREASDILLQLLGVSRPSVPTVTHPGSVTIDVPESVLVGAVMPDLVGVPKRRLLSLAARTDLRVSIHGDGYVASQVPAAGTPVTEGMSIVLELK